MSPESREVAAAPDLRLIQLRQWLSGCLEVADLQLSAVASDASSRRYFRVEHCGQRWIAMDAPPARENVQTFIRVAELLDQIGVHVPHIMHRDLQHGWLLCSDLGSRTYLDELQCPDTADRLYQDALRALVRIQAHGQAEAAQLPPYDATILQREAALFTDWFCVRHLGLQLSTPQLQALHDICEWLAREALTQPRGFVHRDFHSRNLMVCEPNPGILDFQDALYGPLTYDAVSLLRDCYIDWPLPRVHGWVELFRCELQAAGVAREVDGDQFLRWFDLMGVQRHMKAIGIFARLWYRDGKASYLEAIPRTLGYVRAVAEAYPQLELLRELIDTRVPTLQGVP